MRQHLFCRVFFYIKLKCKNWHSQSVFSSSFDCLDALDEVLLCNHNPVDVNIDDLVYFQFLLICQSWVTVMMMMCPGCRLTLWLPCRSSTWRTAWVQGPPSKISSPLDQWRRTGWDECTRFIRVLFHSVTMGTSAAWPHQKLLLHSDAQGGDLSFSLFLLRAEVPFLGSMLNCPANLSKSLVTRPLFQAWRMMSC